MQNKKIIFTAIISLLIGIFIGYVAIPRDTSIKQGTHRMHDGTTMKNTDTQMGAMNHAMTVSNQKEFIEQMIPHHQEAIDTAKEVLEQGGTTPEVITLAENIIKAQEQEITQMRQWYLDWYNEVYTDSSDYEPMMRNLSNLSGEELDKTFIEDMIKHHMGAIMMAQSVRPHIENEEIKKLTQAIITTQSEEIRQMREMLKNF